MESALFQRVANFRLSIREKLLQIIAACEFHLKHVLHITIQLYTGKSNVRHVSFFWRLAHIRSTGLSFEFFGETKKFY